MPVVKRSSSPPSARKSAAPQRKTSSSANRTSPAKKSTTPTRSGGFKVGGGGARKTIPATAPRGGLQGVRGPSAPKAPPSFSMPSGGELLRDQLSATRRMMDAGTQIPRGPVETRGAEFRTVPAARQDSVALGVRRQLEEKLEAYSPAVARELAPLVRDVGTPHFYKSMARFDPANRAQWIEMVKVQKGFADAEPGYDARTRAYSESMRLTLHGTAVLHRGTSSGNQYETFIRNHVTAFRENGGWFSNLQLDASGAGQVVANTPFRMVGESLTLLGASFDEDPHTQAAAEMVRQARAQYAEPDP